MEAPTYHAENGLQLEYNSALMRFGFILVLSLLMQSPIIAQSRAHARSMVITPSGVVATSQTLASQAGAQILARGGSAVDAAIAANAVLGVMEPMMDGMGGDLFAMYWNAKTGELTGLNSSGPAPKGLSIEFLKDKGITRMPDAGIYSVTVPGAVAGWPPCTKSSESCLGTISSSRLFTMLRTDFPSPRPSKPCGTIPATSSRC